MIAWFIIYWRTFHGSACYEGSRNEWKLLGLHHNLLACRFVFYSHSFTLISRRKLCLSSYQLVYRGWFSAVKINIFGSTDCPIQWFIKGDTISTKPFEKFIFRPRAGGLRSSNNFASKRWKPISFQITYESLRKEAVSYDFVLSKYCFCEVKQ